MMRRFLATLIRDGVWLRRSLILQSQIDETALRLRILKTYMGR